ncbi:MAG: pyridine nucleotide-disulfide oxidoreductase [Cytophagales bacterium CG18_big_fil_WC_8_21_14_2_50_42_9]|nr:MAG: pyridine nucleotide-disulfide oxidoreductase [Cytophagales bacterium CG18_big_fil_WC_8_21_14_2_50_42_9]
MINKKDFDVIIIGGSYAGLSAAMALGRSLRQVLIIDSGKPCNRQTPHSHNFLTQDGETPIAIRNKAKAQLLNYPTVHILEAKAIKASKEPASFTVETEQGDVFAAKKILFTTGLKDIMPAIEGFAACWGISVLHCPYCHGYEVRDKKIGLLGNGDVGYEFCKLISNWSKDLVLFTNGKSTLTAEQTQKIKSKNIEVVQKGIKMIEHQQGQIQNLVFTDQSTYAIAAMFARPALEQHCGLLEALGCALTEQGFIQVDDFQRTTVPGIYAAGDNTTMFRTVSMATAAGTKAGAVLNKELIDEQF